MYKESVVSNQQSSEKEIQKATTIVMFKDQQLLDLWQNEISGQLSDGAYENRRNTEWLWDSHTAVVLGPKNIIYVNRPGSLGSYYKFYADLADVVGDRMMEESGIADDRALKSALWIMHKMCRFPNTKEEDFNAVKESYLGKKEDDEDEWDTDDVDLIHEIDEPSIKSHKKAKEDGVDEEKYDEEQLDIGSEIEKEHDQTIRDLIRDVSEDTLTDFDEYTQDIAEDHLDEYANYYDGLAEMEEELEEEGVKGAKLVLRKSSRVVSEVREALERA